MTITAACPRSGCAGVLSFSPGCCDDDGHADCYDCDDQTCDCDLSDEEVDDALTARLENPPENLPVVDYDRP